MNIYDQLDQFFTATAWKMDTPPSYGVFHLTFFISGLIISFLAAWKLRHVSDKGNRIILLSIGILLLVAEVYKQLFYYFYKHNGSYAWWIFPFQLCSVPMYLCVIAPLLKSGRIQKSMYNFMMIYNLLGGFIAFLEPSGLLHNYVTLTLHSCIWHMLLVFVGLYLAFSGRAGFEMKDYRSATGTFLLLCVVAFCINLIFWDVSGGDINMFFIGPKNSPSLYSRTFQKNSAGTSAPRYIFRWCVWGPSLSFFPCVILQTENKKYAVVPEPQHIFIQSIILNECRFRLPSVQCQGSWRIRN